MKSRCKMMALVLLTVMVSPMALPYVSTQRPQPSAGCHEHGQKAPSPSPVTYQCCRAGHQFVAVRESADLGSGLLSLSPAIEFVTPALARATRQVQLQPWSLAFGPPGATSLRI
jgi:hypothetical protein